MTLERQSPAIAPENPKELQKALEIFGKWISCEKNQKIDFLSIDLPSWQLLFLQPHVAIQLLQESGTNPIRNTHLSAFIPGEHLENLETTIILRYSFATISKQLSLPNLPYHSRLLMKMVLTKIFEDENHMRHLLCPTETVHDTLESLGKLDLRFMSALAFIAAVPAKTAKYPEFRALNELEENKYWETIFSQVFQVRECTQSQLTCLCRLVEKAHRSGNLDSFVAVIWKQAPKEFSRLLDMIPLNVLHSLLKMMLAKMNLDVSLAAPILHRLFETKCLREKTIDYISNKHLIQQNQVSLPLLKIIVDTLKEFSLESICASLIKKWTDKSFVRLISSEALQNIGFTLLLMFRYLSTEQLQYAHDRIMSTLDVFLDHSHRQVKVLGMIVAEEMAKLTKSPAPLSFELPDDDFVKMCRALTIGCIPTLHSSKTASTSEEFPRKKYPSVDIQDSDDEDDGDFVPFGTQPTGSFKDADGKEVHPPHHLRECQSYLISDDRTKLELGLAHLKDLLVHSSQREIQEETATLLERLVGLAESYEDLERHRSEAFLQLIQLNPFGSIEILAGYFHSNDHHFTTKLRVLEWAGQAAWALNNAVFPAMSTLDVTTEKKQLETLSEKIVGQVRWRSSKMDKIKAAVKNRFLPFAECFFYSFRSCLSTRHRDPLQMKLDTALIRYMALVIYCSANAPSIISLVADFCAFLVKMWKLYPLDVAENRLENVHDALLYATYLVLDLMSEVTVLKSWFDVSGHVFVKEFEGVLMDLRCVQGLNDSEQQLFNSIVHSLQKLSHSRGLSLVPSMAKMCI